MTMTQAVDSLLTVPATAPAPPVKNYANTNIPVTDADYAIPIGQTWVNTNTTDGTADALRLSSFKSWWMGQMVNQDRNILEKLVMFWHNHFGTETADIGRSIWSYQHNAMLRRNALGNFKQFVKEVTLDVGMLRYLNGYLNTQTAPDENYGRELQELFTVGKGPNSLYTEADVKAAARALTGWQINGNTNTSFFNAARHDTANKQFSAFYNNTVLVGKTGAAGATEVDDLLNMIFSNNEVALHICRNLYRWFVYYDINAATEANVITPLAQIFRANNYDIKPVLSTLLKSEHFFDVLNQGCQIKSPVDLVVSSVREFEVVFPALTDVVNVYNMWAYLARWTAILQQNIGDPPSVSGWPAYYQEPQFYEIWINSDTLPKRNQFTDLMIQTGYTQSGRKIIFDPVEMAKKICPAPDDPNRLITDSLAVFYRIDLSAASRQSIKKQILLSNQDQDYYWSNAWNAYISAPGNTANYQAVYTRLRDLYKYLMNLSEYQLA